MITSLLAGDPEALVDSHSCKLCLEAHCMRLTTLQVFAAAALVRIALIAAGAWQDAHLPVKYTDIDYEVYSDAARLVAAGRSPYERSTYRYTPLLAIVLTPVLICKPWGKLLFSATDLLAGRCVWVIPLHYPGCAAADHPRALGWSSASCWTRMWRQGWPGAALLPGCSTPLR